MVSDIAQISAISVFILIVHFHTNVFFEYFSKIHFIFKLLKMDKYIEYKKMTKTECYYLEYLITFYNNFFIRLIGCSLCLNFWITLVLCAVLSKMGSFFICYVVSVILYLIFRKMYES
jgi:hypothetical protein